MNRHILIIDNDEGLINQLSTLLALQGNDVVIHANEKEVSWGKIPFDLVILNVDLPGVDGLGEMRAISNKSPASEIILMTTCPSLETAIEAIHYNISDYIVKPTDLETIMASIESIMVKIAANHKAESNVELEYTSDKLSHFMLIGKEAAYDCLKREINCDGLTVHLTSTENRLFRALMEASGKLIEPKALVYQTQGYETDNREASVILRPLISRLRQKLAKIPEFGYQIINIRGGGYMVECNKNESF